MSADHVGWISREVLVAALGANPSGLEPWVIRRLTSIVEEDSPLAGDTLFDVGDSPTHLFLVHQGVVELLRDGRVVETLRGPCVFGMLDALLERPRHLRARACSPLQLFTVQVERWLELLEDSFELARRSVLGLAVVTAALEERLCARGQEAPPDGPTLLGLPAQRLTVLDRLAVLMRTPLLLGAGVQATSDLATAAEELSFAPLEPIFRRGEPHHRIFVILSGSVEATRADGAAKWRGGGGQMVCGTMTLVPTHEWEAHAVAPTRVLAFRTDDWLDLMEENFGMVRAAIAALALRRERLAVAATSQVTP